MSARTNVVLRLVLAFVAVTRVGASASAQCEFDKLTPSDPIPNGGMGISLAVDRDLVVVGAPASFSGPQGQGAAYVFERTPTGWKETARLRPNAPEGKSFGTSVAVWRDTIAVSGRRVGQGHVYVFERGPAGWREVQRFRGPDHQYDFGHAMAMRGDKLLVGGSVRRYADVRRVFVYVRQAGEWVLEQRLRQTDEKSYDLFAYNLAIEGDTIAVGAFNWTPPDEYEPVGAVYVYEHPTGGSAPESLKIESPNPEQWSFGAGVALSGDTIFVATQDESVYFYERAGASWRLDQTIDCHSYVDSVAVNGDTAAMYCWPSEVSVLGRSNGTWDVRSKFPVSGTGGYTIKLALTPTTLVIGQPNDDDAEVDAGAVYFLDLDAPGQPYCCPAASNSTGRPGRFLAHGSPHVADDDLVFVAKDLPSGNLGAVLMSDGSQAFTPPGSIGPACLGGGTSGVRRLRPVAVSTDELEGGFALSPGTSGLPVTVLAGTTWNFQAWYSDTILATSNFTNAVSITFQ